MREQPLPVLDRCQRLGPAPLIRPAHQALAEQDRRPAADDVAYGYNDTRLQSLQLAACRTPQTVRRTHRHNGRGGLHDADPCVYHGGEIQV